MKARLVLACAAAGIAISAFGGVSASAEQLSAGQRPFITVSPTQGVAGTKVHVRELCVEPDVVTSAALTIGEGAKEPDNSFFVGWFATVKDVKPGTCRVSMNCDGKPITTSFTVLRAKRPARPAQVPVKPKGAPETGGDPDGISWVGDL